MDVFHRGIIANRVFYIYLIYLRNTNIENGSNMKIHNKETSKGIFIDGPVNCSNVH